MALITITDTERFDAFVREHPNGHILQTTAWGQFKAEGAWHMHALVWEENGVWQAAAMILERKLPFSGKTMFYVPRGYVLDYEDDDLLEKFTREIRRFARTRGAILIKIDPAIPYALYDAEGQPLPDFMRQDAFITKMRTYGYRHLGFALDFDGIQPRFVFRLPIAAEEEDIFKQFHQKTRYNIRLAQRKGIEVRRATREDLVSFTKLMNITGRRDGFITRPLSYFQKMYDQLEPRGMLSLFMAKHPEGGDIAGAILLHFGDKAWYLYGASDNAYRESMPNYLLQWEMIRYARRLGARIYDFRGISGNLDPEHPLYGLYRFKKGFRGILTEFVGEFDDVLSPVWYALWTQGLPRFRAVRQKMFKLFSKYRSRDQQALSRKNATSEGSSIEKRNE